MQAEKIWKGCGSSILAVNASETALQHHWTVISTLVKIGVASHASHSSHGVGEVGGRQQTVNVVE